MVIKRKLRLSIKRFLVIESHTHTHTLVWLKDEMMIVFLVSIDLFVFPVCLSYNTKRVPDFNTVSGWNKMRIKNGSILNMSFEDVDILINQTGAGPSFNESEYFSPPLQPQPNSPPQTSCFSSSIKQSRTTVALFLTSVLSGGTCSGWTGDSQHCSRALMWDYKQLTELQTWPMSLEFTSYIVSK